MHHGGVTILAGTGVRLITISTDHVFTDGGGEYLTETSPVNPVNRYAASKYRGEAAALENPANAVVRTSWLVGKKECSPGWLTGSNPGGGFRRCGSDRLRNLVEDLAEAWNHALMMGTGLVSLRDPAGYPILPGLLAEAALRRGRVIPVEWGTAGPSGA